MVSVINSQEIVNKGLWSYRPNFLSGNKDAKSLYRFTEEIFNESIKQGTFSPVFDRLELAERMGVSEKTVQRVISKLMANQRAYIERVSKGQYQATLFNTNIDLPADYIIKNFELETKLLTELEKQQQRASNRACKVNKQINNEISHKSTTTKIDSLTINESKINGESKTTSLLENNQSNLEIKTASEVPTLTNKLTTNEVMSSSPATIVTQAQIQAQEVQQSQQSQSNIINSKNLTKSGEKVSLFAKRITTEEQRVDDLFAQLEDEDQDQLIELTTIVEVFWEKTGKLELLKERWREYSNLEWYEFLTEKLMESVKLAYARRYDKLLTETKLSIEDVKKEAISGVLEYWQNINNVSQESIIIPPTILSVGTDNKVDLASLSATSQQNNKQPTRFDRITANFIKNENILANDESQSIKLDTSNSNQATTNFNSNKKLNVRQLMKQSRETKNVNEPAIKPLKKEDKNVLKTNPYAEKPSGFTHVGESLFAKSLGLDKINLNQNVDTSSVNNTNEIAVIGINIKQELNQSNQSNQSKSSSDNFSNFSNNDVLGYECPQIDNQVHNNQNDQAINKLRLVSGHECPQINDRVNNQADNLQNDQFDQLSNNSITNTKEILGHKCPQNAVEGQENDHRFPTRAGQLNETDKTSEQVVTRSESTTAKVIAMPQIQQITGVVAIPVSITTNVTNKVATTTTSSVIAVATSPTTSPVPTNTRMREVKVLEVKNNLNNNLTLKTLRTSFVNNNTVPSSSDDSSSIETNTTTSTSIVDVQNIQQNQQNQQNTENQLIEHPTKNQNSVLETKENKTDKTTNRKKKNKKIGSNVAGNVSDGVGNSEEQKTLSEASIDEGAMRKRLEMDKVVHKDEFRLWRVVGGDYKLERDEQGNWMLPNKRGTLPKSEYSFWDIASFAQSQSTIAKPIAYAVGSYYRGDNDDVLKNHFQQNRNAYVGSSGRTMELTDEDKARLNQQQIELNRMLLKEELMVQLWDKLAVSEQQKLVNEEITRFKQLFPQYYQSWTHQMLLNHNREIVKARLAEEEISKRESQVSLAS